MAKKIICAAAGVLVSVLELLTLGVSPLTALSSMVLPVGFVSLFLIALTDYLDNGCTPLMWACYGCWFAGVGTLGAGLQINKVWLMVVAAVFAVGAVVCYFINKSGLKKAAE